MTKLVYITKSFAQKAGVERILADKMNYLTEYCNYDITLITYEQGDHNIAYQLNKDIKFIDINKRFFTLKRYNILLRIWNYYKLRKAFKQELSSILLVINPDIVISNTYSFNLFDIILNLKYHHIIESHICLDDIRNEINYKNKIIAYFARIWDNMMFSYTNKADVLITLTNADKTQWTEKTNTKVVTIPNMVTYYPTDYRPNDSSKRIICVGRLHHQKGFDMLIKAWSLIAEKYSEWHIDIFGSGDDEKFLNNLIARYKLDSIKIKKPVDNIYDEYMSSAFFVLSSRFEGLPLVLIEAMSSGLACVAFDCPNGPSEMIDHKTNGFLVKAEDISGLASAIEWMILHKEPRVEMGRQARITAKNYTKENIIPLWIDLFNSIVYCEKNDYKL